MFATTGFYRTSNVYSRATDSLNSQVVPGATIVVTVTDTNVAATIYFDPLLSQPIANSTVFADVNGLYAYYIPLNYMVTETISSPNLGSVVIPNIGINGPIAGSLTTSAATSDVISIAGILPTSHVYLQATNAAGATMITSTYVSSKSAGSITVTHPATAGATFDVIVTPY